MTASFAAIFRANSVMFRSFLFSVLFIFSLVLAQSVSAATYTVTNNLDSGAGSLRQAVLDANGTADNDVIVFNIPAASCNLTTGVCTITLASEISITNNGSLTINGTGANHLTIDGDGSAGINRVFSVSTGATAIISGLTVTGGLSNAGGGINNNGTLTLRGCAVSGNTSFTYGGGIANRTGSTLNVISSLVSGNIADGGGNFDGGGGGIDNLGTLNVTNSTISGNAMPNSNPDNGITDNGAGIWTQGATTITNSTITNNLAYGAGSASGIHSSPTTTISNSIVAGNVNNRAVPDLNKSGGGGGFASQGYNIIGNASSATGFNQTGDQTGVDARLAPLGKYGGKTLTHALLDGGAIPSPAINTGTSTGATATDQRGALRVGTVDKGAFEVNNTPNAGTFVAVLPSGSQNVAYQTQVITANNGAFTYSVTSGALPNGVSLTTNVAPTAIVALSGTPTQSGIFNFAITATNGTNSNVTNYRLQILAPTAAGVSVSGRVLIGGRGLTNAFVTLTDQNGNVRSTRTSSFGYYRFDEVAAGQIYVVAIQSKRFQFAPQVVSITEDVSELNFYSDGN